MESRAESGDGLLLFADSGIGQVSRQVQETASSHLAGDPQDGRGRGEHGELHALRGQMAVVHEQAPPRQGLGGDAGEDFPQVDGGEAVLFGAAQEQLPGGGVGLGRAQEGEERIVHCVHLGDGGVPGLPLPAPAGQSVGQEAERGRVAAAVQVHHLPGRLLDGPEVPVPQLPQGLAAELVPPGGAVTGQPDRRLEALPVSQVDLGHHDDHGPIPGETGQSVERGPDPFHQVQARPAGRAQDAPAQHLPGVALTGRHGRSVGAGLGRLKQGPVVADEDHEDVRIEL